MNKAKWISAFNDAKVNHTVEINAASEDHFMASASFRCSAGPDAESYRRRALGYDRKVLAS